MQRVQKASRGKHHQKKQELPEGEKYFLHSHLA
jgi:hypothetical protein